MAFGRRFGSPLPPAGGPGRLSLHLPPGPGRRGAPGSLASLDSAPLLPRAARCSGRALSAPSLRSVARARRSGWSGLVARRYAPRALPPFAWPLRPPPPPTARPPAPRGRGEPGGLAIVLATLALIHYQRAISDCINLPSPPPAPRWGERPCRHRPPCAPKCGAPGPRPGGKLSYLPPLRAPPRGLAKTHSGSSYFAKST